MGRFKLLAGCVTAGAICTICRILYVDGTKDSGVSGTLVAEEPRCNLESDPGSWQQVRRDVAYVYAAHLNPETVGGKNVIQILGTLRDTELKSNTRTDMFSCRVFASVNPGDNMTSYAGEIAQITHGHIIKYTSVKYYCHVSMPQEHLVNAVVSLINLGSHTTQNCMRLTQNFRHPLKYNFTLCMGGPMRGDMDPRWFVEWMELNALFGAQKIVLYNHNTRTVDPYLKHYTESGLLELRPWDFPKHFVRSAADHSYSYLQQTVLSDCFLRMRRHSKYIVQHDMDELIVPRHTSDKTWLDMMRSTKCDENSAQYGARQMVYCLAYPRGDHATKLFTLSATRRNSKISVFRTRSKYIANSFLVDELMNHFAVSKGSTCVMDVEVGGNHHYRKTDNSWFPKTVEDSRLTKYRHILGDKVAGVIDKYSTKSV